MAAPSRICNTCRTPLPPDAAFCSHCGAATPTEITDEFGADFESKLSAALAGRYAIQRELGRGGMAIVYLADDVRHERQVAIKVLRPELAAAIGGDRFVREIKLAAKLNHPHILPLHDSGDADGFLYYVMPFVEGESLRDRLHRERQLSIEEALQITKEVAEGLDCAHEQGVIHRDIKPENILLSRGHALVADFGIAKAVSSTQGTQLTSTGTSIGTPLYMSPEQAAGDPQLDGRTDVYSLGCVLYEMLAGEPPFSAPTAQALMAKHAIDPRPSVRTVRDTVPEAVDAVIQRAMAKVPADRPGVANAILGGLDRGGVESATLGRPSRRRIGLSLPHLQRLKPWFIRSVEVGHRLGRSVGQLRVLLALLAVLTLVLATVWRPYLRLASDYWSDVVSPAGSAFIRDSEVRGVETWRRSSRAFFVNDSLLVVHGGGRLEVFDGVRWSQIPVPRSWQDNTWLTMARDTLWAVLRTGPEEVAALFKWTGSRFQAAGTVPLAVRSTWSDGQTMVVGGRVSEWQPGSSGQYAVLESDGWKQHSTPTTGSLDVLFGISLDGLHAIDWNGCQAGRQQLFEYDGFAWGSVHLPHTDTATMALQDGISLPNGTLVVVGYECDSQRPLLFVRQAEGGNWTELSTNLPLPLPLTRVFGASEGDVLVCAKDCEKREGPCLFSVSLTGTAEPVAVLGRREVLAAGSIRGRLYLLASDGTEWSRPRVSWGPLGMVPGATQPYWYWWDPPPEATPPLRAASLIPDRQWVSWVMLDADFRVWSFRRTGPRPEEGNWEAHVPSDGISLSSVAVSDSGEILAVGSDGYVASTRGTGWEESRIAAESLRAVAFVVHTQNHTPAPQPAGTGDALAVGDKQTYVRRNGEWEPWRALPEVGELVRQVVMRVDHATADTVVVIATSRALNYVSDKPGVRLWVQDVENPTLLLLPDGRLMVGTAPSDPVRGGDLVVLRVDNDGRGNADLGWVPRPEGTKFLHLTWDAERGGVVTVFGSGWLTDDLSPAVLPFAPARRR